MRRQKFMHLLELQIIIRMDGDDLLGPLDAAITALEIIACLDLAADVVKGVIHLCQIGF